MEGAPGSGRRWPGRGGAALAGAGLALAFPTPALWWWAYVGLVPVLWLVRRAATGREAAWRTWLAGAGFFGVLHYWLVPHLSIFVVPVLAAVAALWIPWGVAARALLRPEAAPHRVAVALAVLPALWVLVEYVRSWDRLGGSWGVLGLTQWNVPAVLPAAAVGGVWALSVLLLVSNVAVATVVAPRVHVAARVGAVVVAAVLLAATLGYGAVRPQPPVEGRLRVGGVQPGLVHDRAERFRANERITRRLVAREPAVDVVVWGQSSVGFDPSRNEEVRDRLLALAGEIDRQLVVNVDARRPSGRISKSALVVAPGGFEDTYRKQRLVPFGEYIPLRRVFGWLDDLTEAAREDRVPGTDLTTFELAGVAVGPLISYESTFPDMRRSLARRGVAMTLVQAAATTFQGTWALPQQGSFEAVRAVESGRPAVLVALSGTSSAFDARGRRLAWVPQDRTGGWVVDVPLSREATPYVRWGPWVPVASAAVVAAAAVAALARRLRRHTSAHSSSSRSLVSGRKENSDATTAAGAKTTRAAPANPS